VKKSCKLFSAIWNLFLSTEKKVKRQAKPTTGFVAEKRFTEFVHNQVKDCGNFIYLKRIDYFKSYC
jgi:hypothetical protein